VPRDDEGAAKEDDGCSRLDGRRLHADTAEASVAFDDNGDRSPQRVAATGDHESAVGRVVRDADEVAGRGVGAPGDLG